MEKLFSDTPLGPLKWGPGDFQNLTSLSPVSYTPDGLSPTKIKSKRLDSKEAQ